MAVRSLLILAAMRMEANAVADALRLRRPTPGYPARGSVRGVEITIWLIGIGARWLPDYRADSAPAVVLLAGFSGALDPSLKVGDIVIDEVVVHRPFPFAHRRGEVRGGNEVVSTPSQKAELFGATGALAFDMESTVVRSWTQQRQLPFMAVRSISDRADQTVVPEVVQWVDPWGRPRILNVLLSIARKPRLIGQLRQLAGDSSVAARNLGSAVREIVGFFVENHDQPENRSEP